MKTHFDFTFDNVGLAYTRNNLCTAYVSVKRHKQTYFIDSLPSILLPDEMDTLLRLDSVTLTLRLLGAPLEPILNCTAELQFLPSSYTHIVQCLKAIFE